MKSDSRLMMEAYTKSLVKEAGEDFRPRDFGTRAQVQRDIFDDDEADGSPETDQQQYRRIFRDKITKVAIILQKAGLEDKWHCEDVAEDIVQLFHPG